MNNNPCELIRARSIGKIVSPSSLTEHRAVPLCSLSDVRHAESAVAEPDVNNFGSSCGVESEPLGPGPGYLGSDQQASDFAGSLLSVLIGFFSDACAYFFQKRGQTNVFRLLVLTVTIRG